MDGRLSLSVHIPSRSVLTRQADLVVVRCVEGDKGILPGHERCGPPCARYAAGLRRQPEESLFVLGGTLRVADNVVVLTPGRWPGGVEAELARMEEGWLSAAKTRRSDASIHRAEVALRNALVQMDVSALACYAEYRR